MSRKFFSKYFMPSIRRSKIADRRQDNIRHTDKITSSHHDQSLQKTWSFRVPPISSLNPDQWKSMLWKNSEKSSVKSNNVQNTPQKDDLEPAQSYVKPDTQKISVSSLKDSAPNNDNSDLFKTTFQNNSGHSFESPDMLKATLQKNSVHSSNSPVLSDDSPLKDSAQYSQNQDLLKSTSLEGSDQSSLHNPDASKIASPKKSLWHSLHPYLWKSKIMKNSTHSSYIADHLKTISLKYSAQNSSKTQISEDSPPNSQSLDPKDSTPEDSTQGSDKSFFSKMSSLEDSVQNILGSNPFKTSRSQTSSSDLTVRQRLRKSLDIKTQCQIRSTTGAPAIIFVYHLTDIWCWLRTDFRQVSNDGEPISVTSLSTTGVKVAVVYELRAGDRMVVCDLFKVARGDTFDIQEMTTGSGVTKYDGGQVVVKGKVIRVDFNTAKVAKRVLKIAVPFMSGGMPFPKT